MLTGNKDWTIFWADAEHEHYECARMVKAYNALRAERDKLQARVEGLEGKPWLGYATTRELLDELRARIEVDGKLDYRTVDE